jgi:hypothetical protein
MMWLIEFQARCPSSQSELSATSFAQAASLVEAALSVALLELCGKVEVESVRMNYVDDGARSAVPGAARQPSARIVR